MEHKLLIYFTWNVDFFKTGSTDFWIIRYCTRRWAGALPHHQVLCYQHGAPADLQIFFLRAELLQLGSL